MLRLIKKLIHSNKSIYLESKLIVLSSFVKASIKIHKMNTFRYPKISQVCLDIIDAFLSNYKIILA